MIKYSLHCGNGHSFDAWFRSSEAFERQSRRRLVACPDCGDTGIDRQPMAPAIVKSRAKAASHTLSTGPKEPTAPPPVEVLRAMKRHVLANTEDVGGRFAEEVRKIHDGEAEQRSIRGETTPAEARGLMDDGIPFGVLPPLPEDHH